MLGTWRVSCFLPGIGGSLQPSLQQLLAAALPQRAGRPRLPLPCSGEGRGALNGKALRVLCGMMSAGIPGPSPLPGPAFPLPGIWLSFPSLGYKLNSVFSVEH